MYVLCTCMCVLCTCMCVLCTCMCVLCMCVCVHVCVCVCVHVCCVCVHVCACARVLLKSHFITELVSTDPHFNVHSGGLGKGLTEPGRVVKCAACAL